MRQENNKFLRFPHHITRHTYILVFLCLLVVSSYLTLTGLDNAAFWDDEAQTAIFARNLLTHGELTGWDGRNLYTYRNGSLLNDELNIINPPLDILVCALSFRIFGPSTWSGRIFFALMGLLSFVIFALALKLDFHPTRWQWFFSLSAFMLSPVCLLFFRQTRYYPLVLFFSLAAFYAYRRSVTTGRWGYVLALALSSLFLFYTHFSCVPPFSSRSCSPSSSFTGVLRSSQ